MRDPDDVIGLHQAILEASGVGLLVIGADGLVALVNSRFKALVRVRVDPLGHPALEAIALAELSEVVERVAAGEEVDGVAVATGSADLQIRGRSLPGNCVLIEVHDVTAWQQAERARRDFIANVSHELRTPITAVMGYAETLLADRNELPLEMVSMLDAVERNALRLRDLFDALLRLHRIETRRRQLPLEMQDVLPLLQRAMSTATDHSSRRGLTLTLDCPPTLQAAVNEEALVTMFSNLVNNACQYSDPGGTVDVSAALEDDAVVVRVADRGIGIDSRHHERIFERFYRGDGGRSHRPSGTGLGLAIVRHLALASGCGLSVQSELGEGSEFAVHIPRRASARSRV